MPEQSTANTNTYMLHCYIVYPTCCIPSVYHVYISVSRCAGRCNPVESRNFGTTPFAKTQLLRQGFCDPTSCMEWFVAAMKAETKSTSPKGSRVHGKSSNPYSSQSDFWVTSVGIR